MLLFNLSINKKNNNQSNHKRYGQTKKCVSPMSPQTSHTGISKRDRKSVITTTTIMATTVFSLTVSLSVKIDDKHLFC